MIDELLKLVTIVENINNRQMIIIETIEDLVRANMINWIANGIMLICIFYLFIKTNEKGD